MPDSSRRHNIVRLPAMTLVVIAAGVCLWSAAGCFERGTATAEPAHSSVGTEAERAAADEALLVSDTVRVNLTPNGAVALRLAVDGPFRLNLLEPAGRSTDEQGLPETEVRATAEGIQFGRRLLRGATVEIVPAASPAVWVNDHQYRGLVRVHHLGDGQLIAVNLLPLHAYLASVVDSEMPAAFPRAAREAQAIVSRTYALYQMAEAAGHPRFDLYATTRSQNYLGFQYRDAGGRRLAGESEASRSIVLSTAGQVLTHDGELVPAYYSAVCGGETTDGALVFRDAAQLRGVPCRWCRQAELYRWTARVRRQAAARALAGHFARNGKPFGRLQSIAATAGGDGAAIEFEVGDGVRRHRVAAATLRREIFPAQLHSPRFTAELTGDSLLFAGRGSGHGVGLCQWGARGMALSHKTAVDIVRHYYPGTRVTLLSSLRTAETEAAQPHAAR